MQHVSPKIYKVMKKIYLVYQLDLENSKSFVIRVFSKESHAFAYCDWHNKNNTSPSTWSYYYDTEDLLSGRTADYFMRPFLEDSFE